MVLPFLLPCIFSILHYVLTLMAIAILGFLRIVLLWMGNISLSLIENSNAIRN